MLQIDDHIDDLFRRASENYPLKTDGADWSKVMNDLNDLQADESHNFSVKNNSTRLLWLCLLLPIAWICNHYPAKSPLAHRPSSAYHTPATGHTTKRPHNANTDKHEYAAASKVAPQKELSSIKEIRRPSPASIKADGKATATKAVMQNTGANKLVLHAKPLHSITRHSPSQVASKAYLPPGNIIHARDEKMTLNDVQTPAGNLITMEADSTNMPVTVIKDKDAATTDSANKNATTENSLKTKALKKIAPKNKGLYAGLVIGPDVSTVKYQAVKKTGTTIGLIVGFQFSKRFNIEAGVYSDKKYYISKGTYFDVSRTPIPPTYNIDNYTGSCRMIDFAVNARYNFSVSARSSWFAIAGASSYYMKKEDYDYSYKWNNMSYVKQLTYTNSSNNVLSMINLGVGYTHTIGTNLNLRVEPYVKVPLRGVGIGNLPIMSSGVYIGVTKKIF